MMNANLTLQTIEEGLRFEARTGEVSFTLDGEPGVSSSSPVQAVLASLGACTAMDVISILRKKRMRVTGYEVVLGGERATGHPRVFTKIEALHRLRGHDLEPAAIAEAIRLSETKYCTVSAMLRPAVAITNRFEIVEA